MQLRIEQLGRHLAAGRLAPFYVVSGDEALLCLEAQDEIRRAARAAGFTERQVVHADARTDWSVLAQAASGLSLFAEQRLIEVRLPTGKPGRLGGEALAAHAARELPDTLTLLALPQLEWSARKAAWVEALRARAVWVDVPMVGRERLPAWLAERLARQQHRASPEALEFLADRLEGNLLAAHQEMARMAILIPPGPIDLETAREQVRNVARYAMDDLPAAMLAGPRERIVRLVEGLRAEGEPLPLVLWVLAEELRTLLRMKQAGLREPVRGMRLTAPAAVVARHLPQIDSARLAAALAHCARLDRIAKGIRVPGCSADAWVELADLALGLRAEVVNT
jgi:DNA polymerase-3 subunit delta